MTICRLASARVLLGALLMLGAASGAGAVTPSPAGGRLIARGGQSPAAISDGAGGVIVAWRDAGSGVVLLNRFDSSGGAQWAQGMAYPADRGVQLAADGAGGAIVAEQTASASLVRRYRQDGASLWHARAGAGTLAGDGGGGAWILRHDRGILAERVAADGTNAGVVRLTEDLAGLTWPAGVADGSGGVYVAWRRNGALRMNWVRADGTLAWGSGVTVFANAGAIGSILLAAGASEPGAYVAWHRARALDVASVAADGTLRWTAGVPTKGTHLAAIAADLGGVAVLWSVKDQRGSDDAIVAARFDARGARAWTTHLAWTADPPSALRLQAARGGGVFAGWQVPGLPFDDSTDTDLYLQRLDVRGLPQWRDTRLATSLGPDVFGSVVPGFGGAVVAVFAQSPCLMPDATGIALQRFDAHGNRGVHADGACPSIPALPARVPGR